MDLKSLGHAASQLSQSNHQQSTQLLQEGFELLERSVAIAEPFCAQTLHQAAEKVIKSLTLNSKSFIANLMMANIMLLAEESEGADFYLQAAQALEPENPFVEILAAQLEAYHALKAYQAGHSRPPAHQDLASDMLYAQLESQLVSQLAVFMQHYRPGQISLQPQDLALLNQQVEVVSEFCQQTEEALARLDAEWDTQNLHKQFSVFLKLRQQMHKQLELTQAYHQCLQTMRALEEQAELVEQQVMHKLIPAAQAEANIEQLLDQLDLIADRIDAYESQGHPIALLTPSYEKLVAFIQELQNTLDNDESGG